MSPHRSRIRLTPQLSSITLDDVLTGETCEPIGLTDFEAYLTSKEHSVENLRFVVWYQSYRRRFFALPTPTQDLSPGPRDFNFALPTPARTAERISRTSTTLGSMADEPLSPIDSPTSISPMLSRIPSLPLAPNPRRPSAPPETQPFREECELVASSFLVSSAPYELSLPSPLLSSIIHSIAVNTHPDVLLPAYEHAYDALHTHSLPHFLADAQNNINWEKTLYWWLYGLFSSAAGWAVAIGCLFIDFAPETTQGRRRAWRLLAVPLLTLGAMQMYSAYRGFCSQVWGRGATQLKPWELAPAHPTPPLEDTKPHIAMAERATWPPPHDHAPTPSPSPRPRIVTDSRRDAWGEPPPSPLAPHARVFGPERVVLDPRIRAVHRRIMRDMLWAGFVAGSVLAAVVLVLPCAR